MKNKQAQQQAACALLHHFFVEEKLTEQALKAFLLYMPIFNLVPTQDTMKIHINQMRAKAGKELLIWMNRLNQKELNQLGFSLQSLLALDLENISDWKIEKGFLLMAHLLCS